MIKKNSERSVYLKDYHEIDGHLEKARKLLQTVKAYKPEAAKALQDVVDAKHSLDAWFFSLSNE